MFYAVVILAGFFARPIARFVIEICQPVEVTMHERLYPC